MDHTIRHLSLTPGGRPLRTGIVALGCAVALTACGAGDDGDATPPSTDTTSSAPAEESEAPAPAEEVAIAISDFAYEVPESVPAGAEITVTNEDSVAHTVTADDGETFDVEVGAGESVTFTAPEESGEFAFHCTPHPQMTGTLVVG
ncbi:cupredoxin domain-containing protein [Janibacter anophelis]|uniref:cupredoxin domain-containing protein n=1 Tax=Janibacter anophelis TaxID=319054 RepID=UPI000DEF57BA|nr:cupredoxin domain-containing protein [Janibacter anophelis]